MVEYIIDSIVAFENNFEDSDIYIVMPQKKWDEMGSNNRARLNISGQILVHEEGAEWKQAMRLSGILKDTMLIICYGCDSRINQAAYNTCTGINNILITI